MSWLLAGLLGLAPVMAHGAPAAAIKRIEPAVVTVGKPHQVTITHAALGENGQVFFQPGGPYVQQRLVLEGQAAGLAVAGETAYAVGGFDGIEILHLSAENSLQRLGRISSGRSYHTIRTQDGKAYALATQRLDIFSLADKTRLRLNGSLDDLNAARDIAISGTRGVLLSDGNRLTLLALDSPAGPRILGTFTPAQRIQSMQIAQGILYLAAGEEGLLAMDLRPPQRGKIIGRYRTTGPARDVSISGHVALVANGPFGITLLDISDPAHITWLGSHQQLGKVRRVGILDQERAYAINEGRDVLLIDIGNPALPSLISAAPRSGALNARRLSDDTLLLTTANGLGVLDIQALPPQISNEGLDSGQGVNYGGERKLMIQDGIAYVADWFSGIHLYDISDGQRPRLLSSFHTQGSPKGVVVRDGVAYVADDDHGLQIIDVSDPRRPRQLSSLLTSGLAYTPVLAGDLLYLASHRGGFQVVDVSEPAAPVLVADVDTPGKSWSIQVRGDYAYVADDDPGLLIYDIRDPASPRLVARFDPGGAAEDVLLDGNTVYVAFFDQGVYALDISDPANPRELSHVPTPGNARGLELDGDHLYVADWLGGIQVLDVSQPRAAAIVGSFDTAGASWGLRIHDGFAYVADWWGGFIVLDVRDPRHPRLAGSYHHNDTVRQVATRGMYAYVAKGRDGLQVFDINNALNPTWVTGVATGPVHDIVITGHYAVTCGGAGHITIVDIADPFRPRIKDSLTLDHDCDRLRSADGSAYVASLEGAITRLDPATEKTSTAHGAIPALNDLWVDDGPVTVLGRDGEIRIYQGWPLTAPQATFRLTRKGATHVRAACDLIAVHQAGQGITLLSHHGGNIASTEFIPLTTPLGDLRLQCGRLYATTGDDTIHEFILTSKRGWHIKTRYQALNPVTRLHVRGNTLYGAGMRHIIAFATLPDVALANSSATSTQAGLPADMPNGAYDVVLMKESGDGAPPFIAHNGLTIEMPAFGKPSFTMEDLKRIMKQRQTEKKDSPPAPLAE